MKITVLIIMLLTILSKILGMGREITLSYFYGASEVSDVYLIALTIPGVILGFVSSGIMTGYIPIFRNIENKSGKVEANRYTNNIINLVLLLCLIIFSMSMIYTPSIVKIFASGFEGATLDLAVAFTRITLFGIFLTGLLHILQGYLQIKNNFVVPALIGLPSNIIIIISIVISYTRNLYFLAIGSVIALASQVLLLLIFSYREGFRYKLSLEIKDENVKRMILLAVPVILGTSTGQINQLVDRTLASQIATGGISALSYAHRIDGFIQGIFIISIVTVLYPQISKMVAEDNIKGMKKSIISSITGVNLFVIPATIGIMVLANPIVSFLFGRGAFDEDAMIMTTNALFFYSIGMLGIGIRKILSRGFYALQDTKTPMINSAIAMGINIILNIILSRFLGIGGLALATSISSIVCMLLMFISLRKKIGSFGIKGMITSFVKITLAASIMGIVALFSFNYFSTNISDNVSLIFSIGIGTLTYFIIIYFMKIDDVDVVVNSIKRKIKKREAV